MLPLTLLAASLFQGPGGSLSAAVNDPASHGLVGDNLLSLDEAIRLANGTLARTLLSAAEQARLLGTGTQVDTIHVDAMITPTITLSAPLTAVMGASMTGPRLLIMGMPAGGMMPALQGGSFSHVLALRTHLVTVMDLHVIGGQVGIDVQMTTTGMPVPEMAMVMGCEIEAQTQAGIRLHGTTTDESMLMALNTRLSNMPIGFQLDDQTNNGMLMGEAEFITMNGVTLGCDVVENGMGNLSMFMLFRSTFHNGQTLAKKRRTQTSTQQFMFRFVHCDVHCDDDVIDVEGNAAGLTMVHHHHSDFVAGATHKAFFVWPRTAEFDLHGSEMRLVGDVMITGNPFTMRVWQQNNQYENGTVTYDCDGALPNLLWNRYLNCALVVPATARSPVTIRSTDLINSTVTGLSVFAPITLQGCFRSGTSLSGQVTETTPAPARFLGTSTVVPIDPQIGGNVRVSADLPNGIVGIWDFSLTAYPRPVTTVEPVRFYGDPFAIVVLPGIAVFQSYTDVPLPNDAGIVGMELYAQLISLPLFNQPYAPTYHLPRGGLIRPRL